MTFLDGCLSTSVLAALALNASLGWWWTDPIAALLVAVAANDRGHRALPRVSASYARRAGQPLSEPGSGLMLRV